MPGGRPRLPGTEEERAQWRRDRIRRNVQRYRQRHRSPQVYNPMFDESEAGNLSISNGYPYTRCHPSIDSVQSTTVRLVGHKRSKSNPYLRWISQQFPFRLSFGPIDSDAYLPIATNIPFRGQLTKPEACLPLDMSCGSWVRQIYTNVPVKDKERQFAAELVLSTALRNLRDLKKDSNFTTAILEVHTNTVARLGQMVRYQLKEAQTSQSYSLAGSIMAFAVAELLAHSSWERFIFHIRGAGAIFEAIGPGALKSRALRKCFDGYRAMALPFALMDRRSDFSSKAEWLGLQPSDSRDSHHVRSSALMDIMYLVPAIMEEFDNADTGDYILAKDQLRRSLAIRTALESWMQSSCPENPWRSMQNLAVHSLEAASSFPTGCMANLLIAYCGANVVVSELCADIASRVYIHSVEQSSGSSIDFAVEMENWVNKTCWSLRILSDACPQSVGKLNCLFSLHASLKACAKLTTWNIDMSAIAEKCRRLGTHFRTNGFPLFPGWVADVD